VKVCAGRAIAVAARNAKTTCARELTIRFIRVPNLIKLYTSRADSSDIFGRTRYWAGQLFSAQRVWLTDAAKRART